MTTQPTVSCLLLNSYLVLKILKNKEALVEMKSTIRFFFVFFYIFSQNRRKNLSLNTDYILFFPRPVYMAGQERKLPSFILLIWTSWIQLILVSHEWGIFKHLSLTTENLQIQILCQTWLSSLAQMNLNSHMTNSMSVIGLDVNEAQNALHLVIKHLSKADTVLYFLSKYNSEYRQLKA